MNKKLFFGMFAAASMLFATSCSNDEMDGLKGNESVVSFTLEQPGISTRAYSDGLKATNLTYAVYETESGAKVDDGVINGAFSGKQASVIFTLEKDKTYDFIFWADAYGDAETSPYSFDPDTKCITVNNDVLVSNDENRDAFYATRKALTVPEGSVTETITLYRPFAQLNIGAIGDAIGFTPTQSMVEVNNIGTTLNLYSGEVSGGSAEEFVTYALAKLPEGETFPVVGVDNYFSMNYLLVGKGSKELVTVKFSLKDAAGVENSRTFNNIPVQGNHRTNIYGKIGNILSNSASFIVEIDERYDEPVYNEPSWESLAYVFTDEELAADEIKIGSAEKLAGIAKLVNSKANSLNGKTITLTADIDLENRLWTPIGQTGVLTFGYSYAGPEATTTFNGNGHTIKNLAINSADVESNTYAAGLFGWIEAGTGYVVIENLTIDGATVNGKQYVGAVCGNAGGNKGNGKSAVIKNCHVKNAAVSAVADKAGAVLGLSNAGEGMIENCTVSNSSVSAGRDAGQVVGAAKTERVTGCSATNVSVTHNGNETGANINNSLIGRVL